MTGVLAGVLYSNFLLDALLSRRHDWFAVVSELEMPGYPTATLLRTTDVVCSLLVIGLALVLGTGRRVRGGERLAAAAMVVFALGGIVAALVPLPCRPGTACPAPRQVLQDGVHDTASLVSQVAIFVSAGAIALALRKDGPRWLVWHGHATFWVGGLVGTVLLVTLDQTHPGSWQAGLVQRLQLAWMSTWIYGFAVATAVVRARPDRADPQPSSATSCPASQVSYSAGDQPRRRTRRS